MTIFSSVSGFVSRNKTRFAWVGGIAASGVLLYKYAQAKWEESNARHDREQTAKSKQADCDPPHASSIRRRFENNMQDCPFVVASLLPTLGEHIFTHLDVELITAKLQQSRATGAKQVSFDGASKPEAAGTDGASHEGAPQPAAAAEQPQKTKLELWEEIKLLSFTRTIASIYLINLLAIFTTVQLNILGRYFYLDSVVAFSNGDAAGDGEQDSATGLLGAAGVPGEQKMFGHVERRHVSVETEQKYLTFSWYLLNVGWEQCVVRVRSSVEKVVSSISLKESTGFNELSSIIADIRKEFERDSDKRELMHRMDTYLLPAEGDEGSVLKEGGITIEDGGSKVPYVLDPDLKRLLDDTRDFLEGPDFEFVLKACLDESFDLLLSQFRPSFFTNDAVGPRTRSGRLSHEASQAAAAATGAQPSVLDQALAQDAEAESVAQSKMMPLATVLPIVSRTVHHIVNGVPNLFLDVITSNPKLQALSVLVYTGWDPAPLG
ncbi:peroxin [Polyrhizophydium stewartii]|uniref:Peroxin n=1 Tax=Polyrhizophydium stewartii TaxID=2732419 RepID=A0ABR4MWP5_9FUNG